MHKIKDLDGVLMMLEGARTQNASFSLDRQLEIKRQQYRSVMENEAKKIYILSKYTSRKWEMRLANSPRRCTSKMRRADGSQWFTTP